MNNLLMVNRGESHFGICQERFLINAYNNLLEFKTFEKLDNLRFVSALYFESMNFIVKDFEVDSQGNAIAGDNDIVINSVNDLHVYPEIELEGFKYFDRELMMDYLQILSIKRSP